MMRERMKPRQGKFFLAFRTRFGLQYYRASGVFDVGTDQEESYLYWTRYPREAFGFNTVKTARAMAEKLLDEHGIRVMIVGKNDEVIL